MGERLETSSSPTAVGGSLGETAVGGSHGETTVGGSHGETAVGVGGLVEGLEATVLRVVPALQAGFGNAKVRELAVSLGFIRIWDLLVRLCSLLQRGARRRRRIAGPC